jgi:FkbM family methyltransferase
MTKINFYIQQGYKVIGVDADSTAIHTATEQFKQAIINGQLILVHSAISDKIGQTPFYISKNSEWSSLHQSIANRENNLCQIISVPSTTLPQLFEHGVPHYCKIDIEGADIMALNSLDLATQLPEYISVESECLGEDDIISETEALKTLTMLYGLGYRQFKLVEQNSLYVLRYQDFFFRKSFWHQVKRKVNRRFHSDERSYLNQQYNYDFPYAGSGPFGVALRGKWYDYATAKVLLLEKRQEYFDLESAKNYGFWCDWHATF